MMPNLRSFIQIWPGIGQVLTPWRCFRRGLRAMREDPSEIFFTNLTGALTDDPRIRVPEFNGIFTLPSRSDLFRRLIQYGQYEPQLVACCKKLIDPDRDVVDVGANIGFYSVFFAKLINKPQRVLAIEPTVNALKHLRMNLADNDVTDKVHLFEGVALDVNGETEIHYIEDREEYSSVGVMEHPIIHGAILKSLSVPARTIDELTRMHDLRPGFVKIDVEGMEHKVIEGMREVMKVHRPVILAELSNPLLKKNGSNSAAVIALIRSHGYEVQDPLFPQFSAGTRPYGDILCIPR